MFDGNWRETVNKGSTPSGPACVAPASPPTRSPSRHRHRRARRSRHRQRLPHARLRVPGADGIPDALDGAVAKASGTSRVRGAFFDSCQDRVTDALLFGGVTWYLASNEPGRISMLPVAVMARRC